MAKVLVLTKGDGKEELHFLPNGVVVEQATSDNTKSRVIINGVGHLVMGSVADTVAAFLGANEPEQDPHRQS